MLRVAKKKLFAIYPVAATNTKDVAPTTKGSTKPTIPMTPTSNLKPKSTRAPAATGANIKPEDADDNDDEETIPATPSTTAPKKRGRPVGSGRGGKRAALVAPRTSSGSASPSPSGAESNSTAHPPKKLKTNNTDGNGIKTEDNGAAGMTHENINNADELTETANAAAAFAEEDADKGTASMVAGSGHGDDDGHEMDGDEAMFT